MSIYLKGCIALLCAIVFHTETSAQWHKRDLSYAKHNLFNVINPTAIHFSDPQNGYVIGGQNILHFDGNKWMPVLTERNPGWLTSVFTVNDQTSFFGGYSGLLFKYNGNSITYYKNIDSTVTLKSIFMIDSANGWVTGTPGRMYKISGDTAIYSPVSYSSEITGIYFDTPNHGWAVGYNGTNMYDSSFVGLVYEYKNGDWESPSIVIRDKLNAITSTPSGTIFIAGDKNLYTLNKQSYVLDTVPNTQTFPIRSISMATDSFGVAVGDKDYLIYKNRKWESFKAAYTDMKSVFCVDTTKIWCINYRTIDVSGGQNPNMYDVPKTNNYSCITYLQGNKWTAYPLTYLDTTTIHPYDYSTVNIAGFGKKHVRVNGDAVNLPTNKDWSDTVPILDGLMWSKQVKIFDKNTAWGNTTISLSYYHNDTISTVIPRHQDESISTTAMHMFDDTSAFMLCRSYDTAIGRFIGHFKNNLFLKTYPLSKMQTPVAIHFADRNNGWIVGDSGLIIKYNHITDSWENVESPVKEPLINVFTIDKDNAWIIGVENTLLKWNGITWNVVSSNTSQRLHSLYFTDKDHGWAVGQSGIVMKYKEGLWSKDTTLGNNNLHTIYMVNKNYGWAGGDFGAFYQYINADTTQSGRIITTERFSSISPNPVGSQASIQFNLAIKGNVYIKIYNQTGQLSATYNPGSLGQGVHSYTIETFNLLNGIYIYHIVSSSGEKGSGRFMKL